MVVTLKLGSEDHKRFINAYPELEYRTYSRYDFIKAFFKGHL